MHSGAARWSERRERERSNSGCKMGFRFWKEDWVWERISGLSALLELWVFWLKISSTIWQELKYKDLGTHTYIYVHIREDKLLQYKEKRWQYQKPEKLFQRSRAYIGNGQEYALPQRKQPALSVHLYPLNHFHHIQLLWQTQPKDLAGLSKTNRVLSESHTRTRTNKTIWHYFNWSTVLISSPREIKDFLRAHKENQLKLHILSSFWSKRKQRCSFIFFPERLIWKKFTEQVGWKSKSPCEAYFIYLVYSFLTNILLILSLCILFTVWIFPHSRLRQW